MKRTLCLLFACALCCWGFSALAVEEGDAAGAADPTSAVTASPTPVSLPQPLQVEVTLIDGDSAPEVTSTAEPSAAPLNDETAQTVLDTLERIDANTQGNATSVLSSVASVSDLVPEQADREGLAGVISGIFGDYTPRTYTTSTYIDGEVVTVIEIVPGVAGLDWPWLCGAALFGIMLFCLFKLLGGIWK